MKRFKCYATLLSDSEAPLTVIMSYLNIYLSNLTDKLQVQNIFTVVKIVDR